MADISIRVSRGALELFRGENGLPAAVGALSMVTDVPAEIRADQIQIVNVAPELAEKTAAVRYPVVHLYCDRVSNTQREKFRRFSGKVRMVAEIRVSQGRIDGIERMSQMLSDAVTEVLDGVRGDWGNGMFYGGGYEIVYGAVKHGAKNFIQLTKVVFEVDVSAD